MKSLLVKVFRNGSCRSAENGQDYHFLADVPVVLPEDVLAALGEDKYEVVDAADVQEQETYQSLLEEATRLKLVNLEGKTEEELKKMVQERKDELQKEADERAEKRAHRDLLIKARALGIDADGKKFEEIAALIEKAEKEKDKKGDEQKSEGDGGAQK